MVLPDEPARSGSGGGGGGYDPDDPANPGDTEPANNNPANAPSATGAPSDPDLTGGGDTDMLYIAGAVAVAVSLIGAVMSS
jgi:hypothetical protein